MKLALLFLFVISLLSALVQESVGYDVAYSHDSLVSLQKLSREPGDNHDAVISLAVNAHQLEQQGLKQPRIQDVWATFGNNAEDEINWNDDAAAASFLANCDQQQQEEEEEEEANSQSGSEEGEEEKARKKLTLYSSLSCSRVMHIVNAGYATPGYSVQIDADELLVKFRIAHERLHAGKPFHVHVSLTDATENREQRDRPTYHVYGRGDFVITSSTSRVPSRIRSSRSVSSIEVSTDVTNQTNTGLWTMVTIFAVLTLFAGIGLLVHYLRAARGIRV
jgi:hypothetical protein